MCRREKESSLRFVGVVDCSRAGCRKRYIDQKLARKGDAGLMPEILGIHDHVTLYTLTLNEWLVLVSHHIT